MKKILSFLIIFLVVTAQAQVKEYVRATIDKDCYITGEQVLVHVSVTDENRQPMKMSRVAYVELCDTQQMYTQCMVWLTDGEGSARLELPGSMHSGNYQMNVYTRYMRNFGPSCFFRQLVPVVNLLYPSADDDVEFVEDKELHEALVLMEENAVENFRHITQPSDYNDLVFSNKFAPELDGHIVMAKATDVKNLNSSRLALVGKHAMVFDGQIQKDGMVLYYTRNLFGSLPVVINGYTLEDDPAHMEYVMPYEICLPKELPSLTVVYNEDKLKERSIVAQKAKARREVSIDDAVAHSKNFMGEEPDYFYDLDEWTKFKTVREILIEFIAGARTRTINKHRALFTIEPGTTNYSKWPALVLLDGMPVYDVDALMTYDARRLKYVQIYHGRFLFGENICSGVVSFISRKGALQDFLLDKGSQMYTYDFPQN